MLLYWSVVQGTLHINISQLSDKLPEEENNKETENCNGLFYIYDVHVGCMKNSISFNKCYLGFRD